MIEKLYPSIPSESPLATTALQMQTGIAQLWQARHYAADAAVDKWEFALEIERLGAAGLTISDLRWLVIQDLAERKEEQTRPGDASRSFCARCGLKFTEDSCFVLTESGLTFASRLLRGGAPPALSEPSRTHHRRIDASATWRPRWDPARRQLSLAETIVKRFRVPAPNQELILTAFQEEGWPEFIDDPLPLLDGIDPHSRLHDAIYRLNHKQLKPLICFHGNGKGDGVSWEALNAHFGNQSTTD